MHGGNAQTADIPDAVSGQVTPKTAISPWLGVASSDSNAFNTARLAPPPGALFSESY
jgi:hypothetical protein